METQLNIKIEVMKDTDWPWVKSIYEEGISTKNATFETSVPDWNEWDENHIKSCRFIALDGQDIVGWAALSPVSGRCIYRGVAEVSIYLAAVVRGRGIGKLLLNKLIEESENQNIWTLEAGIFPENLASINLHKKSGFREVGYREKIGKMNGVWRDVILLERRTKYLKYM